MSYKIPIYKAEREAGLVELIQSSNTVACLAQAELVGPETVANNDLISKYLERNKASKTDFDLHYLRNILVTTCWNKNDDIFDRSETYAARLTPEDKPVNYEHDFSDIIGHTVSSEIIDGEGKAIAENTAIDELPEKFHIVTNDVLYKVWHDTKLQERMDRIIAEIKENKWFVSMECLFKGFDYGLIDEHGVARILARNNETAFLTKKLRAYGGDGTYENCKVGRVLRNIVFSAKGLVRKPANPESVFLSASIKNNFVENFNPETKVGYKFMSEQNNDKSKPMASDNEIALQKQVAELQAQLQKVNESKLAEQLKQAEENVKATEQKLTKALEDLKTESENKNGIQKEIDTLKASVETKEKEFKTIKDELDAIKAEQLTAKRVEFVKDKLKLDKTKAEEHVKLFANLNDEQFNANVDTLVKAMEAWVTNNPAGPGGADKKVGKTPSQSTSEKTAPKSTSAPTGSGKASGSENADTKVLDEVVPENKPALSTSSTDSGVESLRKSIAEFIKPELKKTEE